MQQQSVLPAIVTKYLADSEADFLDLSDLERVMDQEEQSNKGIIVKHERTLSGANIIDYGKGTLSSRICQIAHDCLHVDLQTEFRKMAMRHPAIGKVCDEIRQEFEEGRMIQIMDRLEGIGCEVYYDKQEKKLTLGLNKSKLFKHFNEHSRVIDLRNRQNISLVNGINPMCDVGEPKHQVPDLVTKSYYLIIDLK